MGRKWKRNKFKYLGVAMSVHCSMREEVTHRLLGGRMLERLWKELTISREIKSAWNEKVVLSTSLYGS